jgi:hypothetical protein
MTTMLSMSDEAARRIFARELAAMVAMADATPANEVDTHDDDFARFCAELDSGCLSSYADWVRASEVR